MTIALIPARQGSKGIPRKNLSLVQGFPLVAYSIIAAKLSKLIDRVIVSTDSEEIANTAEKFGAEVPFIRPSKYAQDKSPDEEVIHHAISWLKENEKYTPELIIHLRPTTPLRNPSLIDKAIVEIKNHPNATSLRSAHACSESPFKWFILQKDNYFRGIFTKEMDSLNKPRQEFPQVYIPNGYVDILKNSYIKKTGKIHGDKVLSFISQPCIEIDTIDDFNRIIFELKTKENFLLYKLKSLIQARPLYG